jgi:hypothetical protein
MAGLNHLGLCAERTSCMKCGLHRVLQCVVRPTFSHPTEGSPGNPRRVYGRVVEKLR